MTKQTSKKSPGSRIQSPLWGIAASILFVAAVLALLIHFGAHEQVLALLQWFDDQGAWAPLLFILIMAAVVVLVLPGVLFTTGAGFVFGVVEGSVYVVMGTTLGGGKAADKPRDLASLNRVGAERWADGPLLDDGDFGRERA